MGQNVIFLLKKTSINHVELNNILTYSLNNYFDLDKINLI